MEFTTAWNVVTQQGLGGAGELVVSLEALDDELVQTGRQLGVLLYVGLELLLG